MLPNNDAFLPGYAAVANDFISLIEAYYVLLNVRFLPGAVAIAAKFMYVYITTTECGRCDSLCTLDHSKDC